MKQKFLVALCLIMLSCSLEAQNVEKKKDVPEEQVTVKREFDENGNLIRFDSLRVYNWSSDSVFALPPGTGWESLFGKDFFSDQFDFSFPGDSAFSFRFPSGTIPFRFFDEEDPFRGFAPDKLDSLDFGDYFLFNDTSFFMGPDRSFMLPPGFYVPDPRGMQELEELLQHHFKSFSPDEFSRQHEGEIPFQRFIDPKQQEEWDQMIQRQEEEQKEFYKKWKQDQNRKKTEKM